MKNNTQEIQRFIKSNTQKIYKKMGLIPGQRYTAEQIKEAYGNFLLSEMAAAPEDINADWKMALKYVPAKDGGIGKIVFYGVRAVDDAKLELTKGEVGNPATFKQVFKTMSSGKGAQRQAANEIDWKAKKEGWHRVSDVPDTEEDAVAQYGEVLGLPTGSDLDALMTARGEAELARRDASEAEKQARAATRGPRGGADAEGFSDRKIYGKRPTGHKVHTGLSGKKYVPVDADGNPFVSQFKAGANVKTRTDAEGGKDDTGRPRRLVVRNQDGSHTQNWGMEESLKKQIEKMIVEHIIELNFRKAK